MFARLAGALDAVGCVQGEASATQPYRPHSAGLFLPSLLAGPYVLLTPLRLKGAVDRIRGHHVLPGASFFVAIALLLPRQDLSSAVRGTSTGDKRPPMRVLLLTLLPALSTITVTCAPNTTKTKRRSSRYGPRMGERAARRYRGAARAAWRTRRGTWTTRTGRA